MIGLGMNAAQRAQIAQVIGGVKIDPSIVDLGAMTKLMHRPVSAINAGIACDPAGTRVALRVDFDVYALREPHLAVTTDRQTLRWDVRNPLAPQLLEATTRHAVDEREEQDEWVLHNGRQLGGVATPTLTRVLANLVDRLGDPHAMGSPRVLGFAETLYLRTAQGAAVYDISAPDQPQEIHTLSAPGWYEDTAISVNIMARHDRARQAIELYEVAARHTV